MGFDVRTYAQKKRKEEETGPELKAQVDRSKPGGGFDVRSYAAQKSKTDEAKSTLQKIAANLKTKTPEQRQADELWNGYDYNAEAERRRQAGGYTPASTEYRAVDTDTNRMTAQGVEDWKQELADRQAQEDNYVKTVSDVSSEEAARDAWKKMHPEWYNEDGTPVVNIYGTDIDANSDRGKDYWDLELKRRDAEREATEAAGYADKLRNGEGNSRAELDPVEGQYQLEQLKQQRDEMKNLGYPAERLKAIDEQISQLESDLEAIEYSRLLLNYSRLAGDVQSDIAGQQGKIAGFGTDEAYADALKAQDKADADYQRQQTLDPTEAQYQLAQLIAQRDELDKMMIQSRQDNPYYDEFDAAREAQYQRIDAQIKQLESDLEAIERRRQLAQYGKYADETDFGLNSRFNYNYRDGSGESTIAYIPTGVEASYGFTGGATTTGMDDADVLYGYVNRVQDVINANQSEIYAGRGDPLTSDKYLVAIEMTDEERSIFNYLFNTGRQEEAQKYFELLTPDLNYRYRASEEARYRQMAEENPVVTSLLTVLTSPDKMITAGAQAMDYIEDAEMDDNAPYNMFSNRTTAVRSQVAKMVERNWGEAGSFAYQTGMSVLENVYQMALTGGAAGEGFMLGIMGTGAAADATIAAKDRGLSDGQAFVLGLLSGSVEVITEKIGLDAFYDGLLGGRTAVRAILQSTLAEGSEEVASTLLDDIADMIITGMDSERMQRIKELKAQGMSDSEAAGQAFVELLKEAGVSGLGGALSGLLMSGGAQALMNSYNAVQSSRESRQSLRAAENGLQALRDLGYGEQFNAALAEQRATARELAPSGQTAATEGTDILPTENAAESLQRAQSEAVPSVTPELQQRAMAALQESISNSFGKAGAEAAMSAYDPQSTVSMNDYVRDFAKTYNAALEGKTATDTVLTAEQYNAAIQAANADRAQTLQTEQKAPIMETERTAAPAVTQEAAQVTPYKQAQFEALQSAEVTSEYIEPITSPEQIKTYAEAVAADRADFGSTIDFDLEAAEQALSSGEITVYSPRAITAGSYVTPSRMNAEDAATGGGRIYSMTVPLEAVAWTDAFSGQYTGEMEGIANGREGDSILSDRGERIDGSRAGEQAEGMVGRAGQARSGNESGQKTGARSEAEGADSLTVAEEKVSSADLGITNGRTDDKLQIVTDGTSEDYKRTKALAEKLGYKVTLVKGAMNVKGVKHPVRGVIQGKNVWIQMDDPDFTGYQILLHEHAHDLILSGEIDENAVRDRLAELYGGRDAIDMVARLYAELYELSTAEEAWTEIVCDSYADMNVFAKDKGSFAAYYQQMLQDVKSNLNAKANTERGPPRANKNTAPEGSAKYSVGNVKNLTGPEKITLQADTKLISENIKNGNSALDRLFAEAENSDNAEALIEKNAMFRTDLGDIDFMWGKPGKGADFHSGFGIAHIVAKRNAENGRGIETAYEMVDVIAKATQGEIQKNAGPGNNRIKLHYNGKTAVLTEQSGSNKWLLTGWKDNSNISEAYAAGEGHDSSGATAAVPTQTRYSGVDASDTTTNVPQPGESVKTESFDKTGIRYSASLLDLESLEEQNEQLRKDLQATTEALAKAQSKAEYWEGQTKRSKAPSPNPTDINRLAHDIIGSTDTNLKANDIKPELTELAEFIMRGGDGKNELTFSGVKERAVGIAHRMLENYSELLDSAAVTDYKEIRKRIRDYGTIQVPGNDLPPDWTDWKRRNGWLRVAVSTGTPLDVVYSDLSESYPWIFPPDANPGSDQLYALVDGVRAAEPAYWNPNDENMAAATEYLANRIIDGVIEDVSQNKTFADRAAKRLSDLRIDSKEKLEAQKAELQRAVRETRARSDERLNNLKAHYKEVQENARQRRADSLAGDKLLKGLRRLENKKLPAVSRALFNEYLGFMDTVAKSMTGKTRNQLEELENVYNDLKAKGEILPDPNIEKRIARVHKTQISDLTPEQIRDAGDFVLFMEHQFNWTKKEIDSADRRDVYQKGLQIISDVRGAATVKGAKIRHNAVVDFLLQYGLDPRRFIRDITGYVDDDPLYLATERINEGQHTMYDYIMRNNESFNKFMDNKHFMNWLTGKNAAEISVVGGDMETGAPVEVKITPDMRISLYLASKNKSNMRHITSIGGGIKVPDIKLYKEGKIKEAFSAGRIVRLTETGVKRICANMSAEELELANAIHKYFNVTSKNALSAVFEKLKGYMMSVVEDYFPIHVVKEFIRQLNEEVKHDASVANPGWLEDRLDNATGPVMLYDATSIVLDAIEQHGKFIGLAIPVSDFNKLYNMSGPTFNSLGERIGNIGVKGAIEQAWGKQGGDVLAYIDKMLADVQNPYMASDKATKLLRRVRSNYAGATLVLNGGVAMKQAGSYPAAAAVLGWEPLIKALGKFGKVDLKSINESTPLQHLRSEGYSTPEFGDLKKQGKQLPKALNWIQDMDVLTTRKLWKACEIYMQDNHPEMRPGTQEYKETIGQLYNRVIEQTQPNYTPMQRPQILRHQNDLLRDIFGMFKTQVYQNFGMLYESVGNLAAKARQYEVNPNEQTKAKYDEAKKSVGRTSSALLVQAVVVSAMQFIFNAITGRLDRYKDKEKEKVTVGSFLKRFGTDVAGNIFGMIPFASDVFSAISSKWTGDKWYGFEGVTPSALTDFVSAIGSAFELAGKTYDAAKSGDFADIQKQAIKWEKAAETGAKFFGVPAENVMKLIKGLYGNIAKTACGKYYGEYLAMLATTPVENNKGEYYDLLYAAEKNGKMDQFWAIYNSLVQLDAMASEKKSTVENIDNALKQREKKDK